MLFHTEQLGRYVRASSGIEALKKKLQTYLFSLRHFSIFYIYSCFNLIYLLPVYRLCMCVGAFIMIYIFSVIFIIYLFYIKHFEVFYRR